VARRFRKVLSRLVDESPPVVLEVLPALEALLVLDMLFVDAGF
jgi:hypothetical protein